MTCRHHRFRALQAVNHHLVGGTQILTTTFEDRGRRHHVAATFADPEDLPDTLGALRAYAARGPDAEPVIADLYVRRADVTEIQTRRPRVSVICWQAPKDRRPGCCTSPSYFRPT